jgi:hypothetical protein
LNNYIYTDLPGFPNEDLLILEKGATLSEADYSVNVSSELQMLLGLYTNQSATIRPMSDLYDWEYDTLFNRRQDARISSFLGYYTFELTVDTSYHTFDFGPGGEEYGFNYTTVNDLNSSRINQWYSEIQDTFDNGTKVWSYFGIDVPVVGPFTFDVKQVFKAPFVISSYSTVVSDTTAIQRAKDTYLNVTQSLDITVGFNFASDLSIELPTMISPGATEMVTLSYAPSTGMELFISYQYSLGANLSYWFIQPCFNINLNGSLSFNIDFATVSAIGEALGIASFGLEDIELGNYINLSNLLITPKFFGVLMEGNVDIYLWSFIRDQINISFTSAFPLTQAIDFFIDDLTLNINFVLQTVVTVPVSTSNPDLTLNETELVFEEGQLNQVLELSLASSATATEVDLILGTISYGLNFHINWGLILSFNSPLSKLVDDLSWDIATFPDITGDLMDSPGKGYTIDTGYTTSTTTTTTTTPTSSSETSTDDGTEAGTSSLVWISTLIGISLIRFQKRKKGG